MYKNSNSRRVEDIWNSFEMTRLERIKTGINSNRCNFEDNEWGWMGERALEAGDFAL